MKKCMFFLLLISLMACGKKASSEEVSESTNMAAFKSSMVQDAHIKKVESESQPLGVSGDENGADIADVKETTLPLNNSETRTKEPSAVPIKTIKKKIIKDGRMGLQVQNLELAKKQIDSLVKALGAYYGNENLRNSDNQSGYEMTIRIPIGNFERFIETAQIGSSKVIYKEVSARDVTQEYIDLETRLSSKRNALARYNEIMKRANAMKDIIELEEAIRNLQEEIESSEGSLRYLNDCADYSTLNLTISTEKDFSYQPEKRYSFWEKFKEAIVEGWFSLVDFILELFGMWPNLLLIVPLYFFIRRWVKRYKAKKQKV